ncbi:MAG: L,D-transpeptidase [Anaerolineales bacterium]|nr:MAG: L,D-transpeptidase [Anaerolineales bacterium]
MKTEVSRRDFLKLAGFGLGALAFRPFKSLALESLYTPKRLPPFPASEIIGRVVDNGVDLRSRPTNNPNVDTSIGKLGADTLVEWGREVIGNVVGGLSNQRYVETPQGYIYGSVVQPTRNRPNTPITEIPAGLPGFWAEVTVPYVDLAHEGNLASPWLRDHIDYQFPPRLYYGQVVWMDQIRQNNGFVEYRWNEDANGRGYGYGGGYGEFFWADGAGFKVLTDADVSMISPDVDPNEKTISLNLDYQTLSCFEGTREVFFCRVSSGKRYDPVTGEVVETYATPAGTLLTHWKIISKNMTAGDEAAGYSTPAVPWCTFIQGGVAIHGAHWHNAFGERRSHGCVNVLPEDAKWIFRWTSPHVSLAAGEERRNLPDYGTIVNSKETKF